MLLDEFFKTMPLADRVQFAEQAGSTYGHVRNVAFSGKLCGVHLAVGLEAASKGAVTRRELRPHDWHLVWPELVTAEHPAPMSSELQQAA